MVGWGGSQHTRLLMEQRCSHIAKGVIWTAQERSQSPNKDKAAGIHLTQPMDNNKLSGDIIGKSKAQGEQLQGSATHSATYSATRMHRKRPSENVH